MKENHNYIKDSGFAIIDTSDRLSIEDTNKLNEMYEYIKNSSNLMKELNECYSKVGSIGITDLSNITGDIVDYEPIPFNSELLEQKLKEIIKTTNK